MDRRDVMCLMGAASLPGLAGLDSDSLFALAREPRRRPAVGVFDDHQRQTVDTIAELIIPATDTPGARAAGVPEFVETIVAEWYHEDERATFRSGLADVDARSLADFGKAFVELTESQQTAILTGMDAEARGVPWHFFARMKELTLFGYYTSEIGVQQELGVVFMPGRYDGAAPVRITRPLAPGGP